MAGRGGVFGAGIPTMGVPSDLSRVQSAIIVARRDIL